MAYSDEGAARHQVPTTHPRFSVVIALYNKARYVASTLGSVLDQSFSDFEIIVIDDGSTDGSGDLVAAFRDPRIRLERQANAGVSLARNRGIFLARGEWVAFLDADDWLHPDYLASLLEAARRYPQAAVLASQFLEIPDSPDPDWPALLRCTATTAAFELIDDLLTRWIHETTFCASSFAVRTELLTDMQPCYPPDECYGEDVDLWFRLADRSSLAFVRSPLVAYRILVSGSLCALSPKLAYPAFLHRLKERSLATQHTPAKSREMQKLVSHFELTLARDALVLGKREQAWQFLIHSVRTAQSARWWITAFMVALVPGPLVSRWQAWRIGRAAPDLGLQRSATSS